MTPGPFSSLIDDELGQVIDRGDGRYDVIFRRRIRKPIEKVWAALTVPERIADWFTEVDLDLRVGGHYRLWFTQDADGGCDGRIVELEPLRCIAHTWPHAEHPQSIVRYELEPDGEGCRLTLTQTALAAAHWDVLAGWHTFLEALPGAAEGVRAAWSGAREREIWARYPRTLSALA
jgi:uncharacterized protein YndB with AHSA1/START domain